MTSFAAVDRIPAMLRAELAAVTGEPIDAFRDDALLSDVGLDSLSLIQALLSVREEIIEALGLSVDEVEDPPRTALDGNGRRAHRVRRAHPFPPEAPANEHLGSHALAGFGAADAVLRIS